MYRCTATKDTVCMPCTEGRTYSPYNSLVSSCRRCGKCKHREHVKDCTPQTNTVCGACEKGETSKSKCSYDSCRAAILFLNSYHNWALWLVNLWFKHILFRRKGLGAAYNATMPSLDWSIFVMWSGTQSGNTVNVVKHLYSRIQKDSLRSILINVRWNLIKFDVEIKNAVHPNIFVHQKYLHWITANIDYLSAAVIMSNYVPMMSWNIKHCHTKQNVKCLVNSQPYLLVCLYVCLFVCLDTCCSYFWLLYQVWTSVLGIWTQTARMPVFITFLPVYFSLCSGYYYYESHEQCYKCAYCHPDQPGVTYKMPECDVPGQRPENQCAQRKHAHVQQAPPMMQLSFGFPWMQQRLSL